MSDPKNHTKAALSEILHSYSTRWLLRTLTELVRERKEDYGSDEEAERIASNIEKARDAT